MIFIKEIEARLIVNFHIADTHFELRLSIFRNVTEDIRKRSRYDTAVNISFSASCNCECLARTGLSISKNGAIIAFKARINHIFCNLIKDSFLLCQHVENAVECELVVVIFYFVVAQAVSLKIELYFPLVRLQT